MAENKSFVKSLAKQVLFFSSSFVIIFFAALLIRIVSSWIEMFRLIPVAPRPGVDMAELAWRTLPVSLYLSILVGLSYSARKKISIFASMLCIVILASIFTGVFSVGINRILSIGPTLNPVSPIQSGPGLIISRLNSSIILLRESSDVRGPRVASFPGTPLIYQELPSGPGNTIIPLPPLPLGDTAPWLIRSIDMDFNLSGTGLKGRFEENRLGFAAYAFSLILLLGSMRFIMQLSLWPLANIFLGALVFRGILVFEVFLNSREINNLIGSFLAGRVPVMLLSPMVFSALGVLIILYTFLAGMAGKKKNQEEVSSSQPAAEPEWEGWDD